jgi:xanthine dehydrogenase accessory factor
MRDVLGEIERLRREGQGVALATVVEVWGSAPRPVGSRMVVSSAGEMAGSVSGGCVEGAVFEEARQVLAGGGPRLVRYGVTNERAWEVGLSCGGEIEIFVEPLEPAGARAEVFRRLKDALEADRLAILATVLSGPGAGRQLLVEPGGASLGDLGSAGLDEQVRSRVTELVSSLRSAKVALPAGSETVEVFLEVHAPRPQLVVVGAVHVAIPLVSLARALGFRTVVIDPRGTFATRERFPHVDRLCVEWPEEAFRDVRLDQGTYVAALSHDPRIDVPALRLALRSPARYVGALGSRKTQAKRAAALEREGVPPEAIARIHSPIGLDLGGRRAEEIALAVMAEVVAVSHGIGFRPPVAGPWSAA